MNVYLSSDKVFFVENS